MVLGTSRSGPGLIRNALWDCYTLVLVSWSSAGGLADAGGINTDGLKYLARMNACFFS